MVGVWLNEMLVIATTALDDAIKLELALNWLRLLIVRQQLILSSLKRLTNRKPNKRINNVNSTCSRNEMNVDDIVHKHPLMSRPVITQRVTRLNVTNGKTIKRERSFN